MTSAANTGPCLNSPDGRLAMRRHAVRHSLSFVPQHLPMCGYRPCLSPCLSCSAVYCRCTIKFFVRSLHYSDLRRTFIWRCYDRLLTQTWRQDTQNIFSPYKFSDPSINYIRRSSHADSQLEISGDSFTSHRKQRTECEEYYHRLHRDS